MNELDKREWAYIQSLGLKPEIKTLEQYLQASEEGMRRGREFLQGLGSGPYSLQEIKDLHKDVFRHIHPWAGSLRTKEIVIDKKTGTKGSDPDKIVQDYEAVYESACSSNWFKNPKGDLMRHAHEMAGLHIALHLIHPVEDGNGRVMRLLLDHQMDLCQKHHGLDVPANQKPEIAKERERYLDECEKAVRNGKLEPLRNLILETSLLFEKAREQESDLAVERAQQEWKERERGK